MHINNKLIQSTISHFLKHINFHGKKKIKFSGAGSSVCVVKDPDPDPHHADMETHNCLKRLCQILTLYGDWNGNKRHQLFYNFKSRRN